ncbi:MAG: S-methyl-5-thioribose-1-phosphate isomerase [Bacteroidota bacterium]
MKVNGKAQRTIWMDPGDPTTVKIIDERHLPFAFVVEELRTVAEVATAIRDMHVRGAPLIGMTAAYGLYLAAREIGDVPDFAERLLSAADLLRGTRPTAINLAWALEQQFLALGKDQSPAERTALLLENAHRLTEQDVATCRRIGEYGLERLRELSAQKVGAPLNILTHCNAGWLACVDYGTATSPIYQAHDAGIPVHVWVDETRPRNQGARLTAWELGQHGVPHTVIADNAGGHLMQHGRVDVVIVGSDRTTVAGDVANKIGTYLKALAAHDNGVPFYVALPGSTIDWTIEDGLRDIPIETRSAEEVTHIQGWDGKDIGRVQLMPHGSAAVNYGFDVTPARLVTGLITERGICEASARGILGLYPEYAPIA